MRINICSLVLYLLLSLLQNKSCSLTNSNLHKTFAFMWPFLCSIAWNTKLAVSDPPCTGCSPRCSKHLSSSSRKGDSHGMAPGAAVCTRMGLFPQQRHKARVKSLPFPAVTGTKASPRKGLSFHYCQPEPFHRHCESKTGIAAPSAVSTVGQFTSE